MGNSVVHAIDIKRVMMIFGVGFTLGAILLFVPMSMLIGLLITLIGLLMIIVNGIGVYNKMTLKQDTSNDLLIDVLGVLAGFMIIVTPGVVVTIIAAIYLLGETIYKLYLDKFSKQKFIDEGPKLILALILLMCSIGEFSIIFKIFGSIVCVMSVGYLLYNYYLYKKSGVKIIK